MIRCATTWRGPSSNTNFAATVVASRFGSTNTRKPFDDSSPAKKIHERLVQDIATSLGASRALFRPCVACRLVPLDAAQQWESFCVKESLPKCNSLLWTPAIKSDLKRSLNAAKSSNNQRQRRSQGARLKNIRKTRMPLEEDFESFERVRLEKVKKRYRVRGKTGSPNTVA